MEPRNATATATQRPPRAAASETAETASSRSKKFEATADGVLPLDVFSTGG
jgi:hypothetical protein